MNEWITEYLPSHNEIILVVDSMTGIISLARFREEEEDTFFDIMNLVEIDPDYCVTHWMNIPDPPQQPEEYSE